MKKIFNKKTLLSLLAFVFIVPAIFFAVGCGNKTVDVTGKTYEIGSEGFSCKMIYPDGIDQTLKAYLDDWFLIDTNDYEGTIISFKENNKGEMTHEEQEEIYNFDWSQNNNKVNLTLNTDGMTMNWSITIDGDKANIESKINVSDYIQSMEGTCPDGVYCIATFTATEIK